MKKQLLLFVALFHLCMAHTQTTLSLEKQVLQATSQLDLSECYSGIFINQVPQYYPLEYFQGNYLSDSTAMLNTNFKLLYGMVEKGHIGHSSLPNVLDFWRQADQLEQSDTLEIMGLFFHYHQFKENSITDNLIAWDGTYFQDNTNAGQSPYEPKRLFTCSASRHQYSSLQVPIRMQLDYLFSNLVQNLNQFEIDYGDGNGWQDLEANQVVHVVYPDTGLYHIKLKVNLGENEYLLAQTPLEIIGGTNNLKEEIQRGPEGYLTNEIEGYKVFGEIDHITGPNNQELP